MNKKSVIKKSIAGSALLAAIIALVLLVLESSTSHHRGVSFIEMPVPVAGNDPHASIPGSWPDDLVGDSEGNIWFAEHHSDEIGRMAPDGAYRGYRISTSASGMASASGMDSIAVDAKRGLVWVSEVDGNRLARLDMRTGHVEEIAYPHADALPGDVVLAPDGTPWFTIGYEGEAHARGGIANLDPATNAITPIDLPGPRGSFDGITFSRDGAVWFVELANNMIARWHNGTSTEFALPRTNVTPTNLAIDSAGIIWVTEQTGNSIARFNPANGAWSEYPVPTPQSLPAGIAIDASDNIWFTEFGSSKIGLLSSGGSKVVEYTIPTENSGPEDIKIISGKVYFTEQYGNKIGQIRVQGITP